MADKVILYTDGACSGNPGPGGWGVVLSYKGLEKELYGFEVETTNNRMELTAVIEGLKALKRQVQVEIYTDSKYVMDGATQWMQGWKAKGWSKKGGLKNADLWQKLDAEIETYSIKWHWVKGHSGVEGNERADALAVRGSEEAKKKLEKLK